MAITVAQLSAFLAVLRSGSVTAAAEELAISQPSVSSALSALSREVGTELFQRVGRGIEPTAAGDRFAAYAADVVGLLEAGRRAALEAAAQSALALRVVAVTTAAESFLPDLLARFGAAHPDVGLTLGVATSAQALTAVLEHRVDAAVVGRALADPRVTAIGLGANPIVAITAPEDPATRQRAVDVAELADRVWLLREEGSSTRAAVERFLAERGLAPETLTLGSNAAIKQAARAGLGVALIARVAVATELEAGLLAELALRELPPARPWYLLHSAVGPLRPPVQALANFLRAETPARLTGAAR